MVILNQELVVHVRIIGLKYLDIVDVWKIISNCHLQFAQNVIFLANYAKLMRINALNAIIDKKDIYKNPNVYAIANMRVKFFFLIFKKIINIINC